jgi:DNA-binding transcriptional MocR family regulator
MTARFPHLGGAIYKQTAKEMVRDKIVSLIASGVLQIGDELPSEREFAEMLLVSRGLFEGRFNGWLERASFRFRMAVAHGSRSAVRTSVLAPSGRTIQMR